VIEDMLRMYVMDTPSKWKDYFHLVEFAYNNLYMTYLKMNSLEGLYGRKCNIIVILDNPINRAIVEPNLLREMEEKLMKIKKNLKVAQDQQKIYTNKGIIHKEFIVGDHVFIKVKAKRSFVKLGNCAKMETRYFGPFEILEKIGHVTYMLALHASMCIHNAFHVSFLKKFVLNANHVID
jgi:hypothetical protein